MLAEDDVEDNGNVEDEDEDGGLYELYASGIIELRWCYVSAAF